AHDAGGLAGLDHVVDQLQRLADARATVDDVAEEQRHAPRMTPDPALQPIAELLEQSLQGSRATMDITDQVVTTRRIQLHQSPPTPSRLPQPSLVRQIS